MALVPGWPDGIVRAEVLTLKGETGELWRKLCEQAAVEQDSEKLLELTREINRLLDEKAERLATLRHNLAGDAGVARMASQFEKREAARGELLPSALT